MLLPLTGDILYSVFMYLCMYVYINVCVCACVRLCVYCMCVCVHACICGFMYVYVNINSIYTDVLCLHMYRRNHTGDKDKALTVMEELLKQQENQVPDFLCLCGRIFKDKFVESNYSDNESRDKAIQW